MSFFQKTFFLALLLAITLFPFPASAEVIKDFNAEVEIGKDAKLEVREEIIYDSEGLEPHGIYRDIPVIYKTQYGRRSIHVDVEEVTRDGSPEPFKAFRTENNIRIRIGNPDVTISGVHTYEVRYRVSGALNYFDEFDELYWNVTGNEWKFPIENVHIEITPPEAIPPGSSFVCYEGPYGSSKRCEAAETTGGTFIATSTLLDVGEGMTVALALPKGVLEEPSTSDRIVWWLADNRIIFLPLLVFLLAFWFWNKHGRDPEGRGTIIAEYEPPENLDPIFVGSLINERVDNRDITAGIIYLAEQSHLKLRKIEGKFLRSDDYEISLRTPIDVIQNEIYRELAKNLFSQTPASIISSIFSNNKKEAQSEYRTSIKLSDLKSNRTFASSMHRLKKSIQEEMEIRGWYVVHRGAVRAFSISMAIGLVPIAIVGTILFPLLGPLSAISLIVSGGIIALFGSLMKKKSKKGAILKERLRGFKEFLSVTEKERLDFHNAPERTPEEFMRFLPYAIAMGVEKKWAKQFESMYIEQPEWYSGATAFSAAAFTSDISSFSSAYSSASAASGGSGSGGFSGGGMGGGGGGSW